MNLSIHPRTDEALLVNRREDVAMLSFLPAYQRRQDHYFRADRISHDRIDDLARRLAGDLAAADPAVRRPRAGEEHAQVIINLRRRRHRRSRIARRRPLLDCNRRRQSLDLLDVRLLELIEELPRISG